MKLKTIALAAALAFTSSLAFAQAGGGNAAGAEVSERSGTAVNGQGAAVGTVDQGRMVNGSQGATTGNAPAGMRRDQTAPERSAPDATEAAPAGR